MPKRDIEPIDAIYGTPGKRTTPLTDEEIAKIRREVAASGSQMSDRIHGQRAPAADRLTEASAARRDETSAALFDPETIVDAQLAVRAAAEAAELRQAEARAAVARAATQGQRKINDRNRSAVDQEIGRPAPGAVELGHSPAAREQLEQARVRGQQARTRHASLNPADTPDAAAHRLDQIRGARGDERA